MKIFINSAGKTTESESNATTEIVVIGEDMTVGVIGQRLSGVEVLGSPETPPTVELTESLPVRAALTFSAPGRYELVLVGSDGARSKLNVLACSVDAFEWLPHGDNQGSAGRCDRRAILRSLANHAPWFTGEKSQLFNQSLVNYGG